MDLRGSCEAGVGIADVGLVMLFRFFGVEADLFDVEEDLADAFLSAVFLLLRISVVAGAVAGVGTVKVWSESGRWPQWLSGSSPAVLMVKLFRRIDSFSGCS